ncbi:PAAR domain-containing protein [uncultured Fretibacterium sp.]|uniref:PAAR domain-containing protein n=1 Tax=uncultured Fretibacterium sp. TaxID=1678694 RepID=UPI00344C68DA
MEGSPDVFVNGIPWHRQGDAWESHCCTEFPHPCHPSVLAHGSPDVFINGKEAGRIGDPVACGSAVMEGSPDVFIND